MRSDECPKGAVPLLVTALDCVATDIISDGPVSALADDVVELHKQLARLQGQIARLLDPEAGAVLLSALQPLAAPLGPDDKRSPAQRRADALAEIANQVLAVGHLPTVASRRPTLNVTISLPSLRKDPKTPGGELDWAGPITAEAARRIGCDASVTRILLGPRSQPLDVGRAHRLVTPAQLKALALRDRDCTWPGCTRASWWCDAHHRISWIDGGETDRSE